MQLQQLLFARHLSKEELLDIAEYIPKGKSIERLTGIAAQNNITILAGLFAKRLLKDLLLNLNYSFYRRFYAQTVRWLFLYRSSKYYYTQGGYDHSY